MAFTAWPFENADTTETQASILLRELGNGVIGGPGYGEMAVSADSTGMTVKVNGGRCLGRGMAGENTATATLTIPTASAATRYDRVVARFDPSTNGGSLAVVPGTSGSTTPGALTQTDTGIFELSLGTVRVVGGTVTIAASDVTDTREWIGSKVRQWTTATRPAVVTAGTLGRNATLARWEWWDGDSWEPLVDWAVISGKPATFPPAAHSITLATRPDAQNFWTVYTSSYDAQQVAIAGKAAVGHTHDDRYYTEAETTALLVAYAGDLETRLRGDLIGHAPGEATRYIRYDEGTGHLVYGGSGVSEREIAWTS